ncbi:hypothetical protein K435DRAFT_810555 [Dendrothele bispora CBS 962.96]|uniref:Uncharacterized protein n=1 Tax=Dendrothele bispora (strain CBS 962.96) TaxID=1314807 RepID=A0A4S8KUQ3_DENBC|nr:hypothetical protein K435DRAFT_810555 [Dendrothele bispora CBS 962.96]
MACIYLLYQSQKVNSQSLNPKFQGNGDRRTFTVTKFLPGLEITTQRSRWLHEIRSEVPVFIVTKFGMVAIAQTETDGSSETVKKNFPKANGNGRIKFSRTTVPPPPFVGVGDSRNGKALPKSISELDLPFWPSTRTGLFYPFNFPVPPARSFWMVRMPAKVKGGHLFLNASYAMGRNVSKLTAKAQGLSICM